MGSIYYVQFMLHTASRQSFLSLPTPTLQHGSWMPNEPRFSSEPGIEEPLWTPHLFLSQCHHCYPCFWPASIPAKSRCLTPPQIIDSFPSWCFGALAQIVLPAPCKYMGFVSLWVASSKLSAFWRHFWRSSYIFIRILLLCIILPYVSTLLIASFHLLLCSLGVLLKEFYPCIFFFSC